MTHTGPEQLQHARHIGERQAEKAEVDATSDDALNATRSWPAGRIAPWQLSDTVAERRASAAGVAIDPKPQRACNEGFPDVDFRSWDMLPFERRKWLT